MSKIVELYGLHTQVPASWAEVSSAQTCPFIGRKCLKIRKSDPSISIGTCTLRYRGIDIVICPHRLIERQQIFIDCIHLLSHRQPGDELKLVREIDVPGGSIDYCLVAVRDGRIVDFVGIELQTMDTTGTIWPERQRFLSENGVSIRKADRTSQKSFGMNWKMTAKTTLVQLHHKVRTFQSVNRHLVLVLQQPLLAYMRDSFQFDHLGSATLGDPMHFHSYDFEQGVDSRRLKLIERLSTDCDGVARCLGLQAESHVEIEAIIRALEAKLPTAVLLRITGE
jgi:Restriction endonuclease NotI